MNREQWLEKALKFSAKSFKKAGHPLPKNVRVASGHMSTGTRSRHIGECWSPNMSSDGGREIWIRPDQTDSITVLGILIHEACHAALPHDVGHRAPFSRLGKKMLLTGKPTEMASGGKEFNDFWTPFIEKHGEYPQPKFLGNRMSTKPKQTTRMVKVECMDSECGMIFRTSDKWIDAGVLACPLCGGGGLEIGG